MSWLAVDENGNGGIYENMPYRRNSLALGGVWFPNGSLTFKQVYRDEVEKIAGKKLTWEDEPIEIIQE
jgi:hypothetical protein